MRQIKFRAWDKLNKRWVNGDNCQTATQLNYNTNFLVHWNEYVLMQFTGLKDRNNQEIYEGDILKDTFEGDVIGVIEFINDSYVIKYENGLGYYPIYKRSYYKPEIIGNIYENPELVRKE